jgi:hypothetical protein
MRIYGEEESQKETSEEETGAPAAITAATRTNARARS